MQWIKLDRLPNNDLKTAAQGHAIPFKACLTRPCLEHNGSTHWLDITNEITIQPGNTVAVPLGYRIKYDRNCYFKLCIDSKLCHSGLMLINGNEYFEDTTELKALLHNYSPSPITILHGQIIAHGIITLIDQLVVRENAITTM